MVARNALVILMGCTTLGTGIRGFGRLIRPSCRPHTSTKADSNKLRGVASRVRGSVAKVSDWG